MNTSLEYIAAGIIMCMILGMTGRYTTNMVYDKINLIESDQGLEKAGKLLDLILLTEGEPSNWGELPDDPVILGFAPKNALKMYKLDKDKVRRLVPTTPGYISPVRLRELMGLSAEYYFSFKIYPLLNLSITRDSQDIFTVGFKNQWGTPVSNVNVTAAYIGGSYVEDLTEEDIEAFLDLDLPATYDSEMTNSIGKAKMEILDAANTGSLLIYTEQLTCRCLYLLNVNSNEITLPDTPLVINTIESSMGSVSGYNSEVVTRNVKIDGFDYNMRFSLWN
ncbi:hypothetical protein GF319_13840 [Candidatus Bathyarchaeota archaeon]|nr:hypothetical protein [Candidatus Bathyarchaeota archaeon]